MSQRLREGRLIVVENLDLASHRTKELVTVLKDLGLAAGSVLVVEDAGNRNLELAARNLPGIEFRAVTKMETYDVLAHKHVLMSEAAAGQLGERLS